MDPVRDIQLNQMDTGVDEKLVKGIAAKTVEKMKGQLREAIAVLKGSRKADSVNHKVRTLAIVQPKAGTVNPNGPGLLYVPSVRSARVIKSGVELTIAVPKAKSITRIIAGAKAVQLLAY